MSEGVPLNFALTFGGWRLAFLIVGPSSIAAPMDVVGRIVVLFTYVVVPMVFIILAAAVASIVAAAFDDGKRLLPGAGLWS